VIDPFLLDTIIQILVFLSDISKEHKNLDYSIQKERNYHFLPTQMHIGQVALITDDALVEQCSTWVRF